MSAVRSSPRFGPIPTAWLPWIGLAVLLVLALVLRWRYVTTISLYVDEFTTLWAAERIQQFGVPRMPSGVLYTRGLLASYIEAAFLSVFGASYIVGRLPSLLFGLVTIGTLFLMGWREWNGRVGLLAAAGLALLPEAIVWSGRARFYAQLQLLALLTCWALFAAILAQNNRTEKRLLWLFAALYWMALFSQEQMILLYPSLLLAMLFWRGWRYLLQPTVLAINLLCLLGIGLRFVIEKAGQPGYFETIQATRPYLGFVFDVSGAWQTYAPLLLAPARLPWTVGALIATGVALFAYARVRRVLAMLRFHQATLFFALQFTFVFLIMLALVGATWRDSRYLFLIQPFWLLCGAAGLVWLVDRFLTGETARWVVAGLMAVILIALFWRPAQQTVTQQVEGYDRVLAYVEEARSPEDVILSPQPPACAQVLGPCDYYAIQRGYEEYVIDQNGVLVDRWSGAPLLSSAQDLSAVVADAPVTWFISDSLRLATRYDDAFLRTVIEQFDIAFGERGVLALRADGYRPPVVMQERRQLATPLSLGPLTLVGWERTDFEPGTSLAVTPTWQGVPPIDRQYNTSLRLVAEDGTIVAQADGPPARGIIPTTLFFDTPLPDPKTLAIPSDLAPGRYRLETVVYDVATGVATTTPQPLAWFAVGAAATDTTDDSADGALDVAWEDGVRLAGVGELTTMLEPGGELIAELTWLAEAAPSANYTAFLHLIGPDGSLTAQLDRAPQDGFFPTSAWQPGDRVTERYQLPLPEELATGQHALRVGWYNAETQDRLPLTTGGDGHLLGSFVYPP